MGDKGLTAKDQLRLERGVAPAAASQAGGMTRGRR
jgi:hypothetical protein